jgi:hypothetical protein
VDAVVGVGATGSGGVVSVGGKCNCVESCGGRRNVRVRYFFSLLFFGGKPTVVVMKVERSSNLETSSSHRRQEWVVCMEFTVRANEDGDEEGKVAAAGAEYRVSTSAGRESSNLTLKEIRACTS